MHTLRKTKKQPVTGSTMWHNPTPSKVTLKLGNLCAPIIFASLADMPVPACVSADVVKAKAPQLELAEKQPEPAAPAAEKPKRKRKAKAKNKVPADLPPVPERLDADGKDTGRTAEQATEKFARELLADTDEKELRQMAKDSALDSTGALLEVARRIAVDAVGE